MLPKRYIHSYLYRSFIICFFALTIIACRKQYSVQKDFEIDSLQIGGITDPLDLRIWSIFQDRNDNYWFGSRDNGLYKYDGVTLNKFTEKNGLISNSVRGIQEDLNGNLFIETPNGVDLFDGKHFHTIEIKEDSSNDWKLESTDLWFNCNGNPNDVYRYDGEYLHELKLPRENLKKAFGKRVSGLGFQNMNTSPYSVFGIDKDKLGNVWFGTATAGAFRYDGNSFLWFAEKELSTLPDGRVPCVRSMLQDKNGFFWLSNFISKYQIDTSQKEVSYIKEFGIDTETKVFENYLPYFNSGTTDKEGNLWLTSYGGGLWKYDGEKLMNFPIKNDLNDILLACVYIDKAGTIWLGSDNDGVYKFDGKTASKFYP